MQQASRIWMTRGPWAAVAIAAAIVPSLAGFARAADEEKPTGYTVGAKVADLEGKEVGGAALKISDLAITPEKAWEAVKASAKDYGATAEVKKDTALDSLSGLQSEDEEGAVDAEAKADLVASAGARFGLIPSEEKVESMKTLGDVATWIASAKDSPILVMIWSPRCAACRDNYDQKVVDLVSDNDARLIVVASNATDTTEHVTEYLDGRGWHWRVVQDQQQAWVDKFGAKRTADVYVLDKDRVLRYRGGFEGESDEPLLGNAITAVKQGKSPAVTTSDPKG